MNRAQSLSAAVALAVAGALLPAVSSAAEIDELRAAVSALEKRIAQLEAQAQTGKPAAAQVAAAQPADKPARPAPAWVQNITWRGDLRLRQDSIDQQYATDRSRLRIRARSGLVAQVNETLRTEFALTTAEGGDPRAPNQTLTGENSRKPIELDLAYAEWAPAPQWRVTVGKMRYPLIRTGQSLFVDPDVNPEGAAITWTPGDFFVGVLYDSLEERATAAESVLVGSQVAWRPKLGPGKLTLGAGYMAYSGVKGRNPFFNGASNGNTTTSVAANCKSAAPCLVHDYNQPELFAEWSQPVAGRPLGVFLDLSRNTAADNSQDSAWSAGVSYGRASDPGTWEVAYYYQRVEKDALFAQLSDSDFAAGLTDSQGSIFKVGYAPARNWVVNGSLYINQTNLDVPVVVAGVGPVQHRDYNRLQIDLLFKY